MNNKGFAVSSIIYGILILFLILIFSILSILVTRGNTLSKIKENALNAIKGVNDTDISMDAIVADFKTLHITSEADKHVTIDYELNVYSPYNYRLETTVNNNKITYKAYKNTSLVLSLERNLELNANPKSITYDYTGEIEEVLLDPGLYRLEVWGAKTNTNGNYVTGYLYLKNKTIIYVAVGAANKGDRKGFNNGATHISYSKKLLSDIKESNIIIGASQTNYVSGVTESSYQNNVQVGNGQVKITSLIYYTK